MQLTLTSILIRTSVMFVIGLILMRLSGKQSIGELSTMDFVVITILGDGFDTIIYGEQPIIAGVVYFATLVLIHILVSFLSSRSNVFFRLVNSPSTLMIHNGMVQTNGLQVERMRPEELAANMRERMEDQLENVKEAWIENNGKLSVVRKTSSKPVQKQDLKPSG
jgi:uncharacterized membrane protein YcaP (DUF421 family)